MAGQNWLMLMNAVMLPFSQSNDRHKVFHHAKMHYKTTQCVQITKQPSGGMHWMQILRFPRLKAMDGSL